MKNYINLANLKQFLLNLKGLFIAKVPGAGGELPLFTDDGSLESSGLTTDDLLIGTAISRLNMATSDISPSDYIYVATTGDDTTGDGTELAPYATIGKAIDAATIEYTADSYVRIIVDDGNYREKGWTIRNYNRIEVVSLSYGAMVIFESSNSESLPLGTAVEIQNSSAIKFEGLHFTADYVLSANSSLFKIDSGIAIFDNCNFEVPSNQPSQTEESVYVISAINMASVAIDNSYQWLMMSNFTNGILAQNGASVYSKISGTVYESAYYANGGNIYVNVLATPIFGSPDSQISTVEINGGTVNFTHLMPSRKEIYINVDANNGNDLSWSNVKTLRRAMEIAARCKGSGKITIELETAGNYNNTGLQVTNITRNLYINGVPGAIINNVVDFVNCGKVTVTGCTLIPHGVTSVNPYVIKFDNTDFHLKSININPDPTLLSIHTGVHTILSNGVIEQCSISGMLYVLKATMGSMITILKSTGNNNSTSYLADGSVIFNSDNTITATTEQEIINNGVVNPGAMENLDTADNNDIDNLFL